MRRTRLTLVVALLGALVSLPAAAARPAPCVLLVGSYPAEVSANLSRMKLDPDQPTTLQGHEFYSGRLDGRRVVTGVAGPSPQLARSTTTLALEHWSCVSAVVFEGTAGGSAKTGLGDVVVASTWTGDEGKHWTKVDASTLAVARATAAATVARLSRKGAVNDFTCSCEATVESVPVVDAMRAPQVIVGGRGVTYGGESSTCSDNGGMLGGCNPCPPGDTGPTIGVPGTPAQLSRAARAGAFGRGSVRAATVAGDVGNSSIDYLVDDIQTTGAFAAARARHVPFIAFRGISDTTDAGDLWPFEYAVYQGLDADNAATAARIWIPAWMSRTT